MNENFNYYDWKPKEGFKRKKPEERKYPKKPTKKEFEEWMEEGTGIPVSFHWEDIGGGRKRGVFTPTKKVVNELEKTLGNDQSVNKKDVAKIGNKQVSEQKSSLKLSVTANIDGKTYSIEEKKDKNWVVKETYYEPRNEKKKWNEKDEVKNDSSDNSSNNKAQQEKEEKQKSQFENLGNKPVKVENLTQSGKNRELVKDKENKLPIGWIVGGGIMLVGVVLMATVRIMHKTAKKDK